MFQFILTETVVVEQIFAHFAGEGPEARIGKYSVQNRTHYQKLLRRAAQKHY